MYVYIVNIFPMSPLTHDRFSIPLYWSINVIHGYVVFAIVINHAQRPMVKTARINSTPPGYTQVNARSNSIPYGVTFS